MRKLINLTENIYIANDGIACEVKLIGISMERFNDGDGADTTYLFEFVEGPLTGMTKNITFCSYSSYSDYSEIRNEDGELELVGNKIDIQLLGCQFYKNNNPK